MRVKKRNDSISLEFVCKKEVQRKKQGEVEVNLNFEANLSSEVSPFHLILMNPRSITCDSLLPSQQQSFNNVSNLILRTLQEKQSILNSQGITRLIKNYGVKVISSAFCQHRLALDGKNK